MAKSNFILDRWLASAFSFFSNFPKVPGFILLLTAPVANG